jgi:hypothetical protein
MTMKKTFAILSLVFVATCLNAQTFQEFGSFYKQPEDVKTGSLNFRLESMGFFQNNEYTSKIVDGYTLTGAMFRPKFTYSPANGLYLEAGAHMLKYNGKDALTNVVPWFSARYCFSDRLSLITGNLDQTIQHGLPEQLWEPELIYTNKPEAGLQFIYSSPKLTAQTWVNWEQFIQKGDAYQEHFTAGVTGKLEAYKNSDLSFKIPVNLLFYHQGGEINIADSGIRPRMQTHANTLAGWELAINSGEKVKTVNLNGYWLGYKAVTEDSNTLPFEKGHAFLVETSAQTQNSKMSLSYWNAFQFIAPKGRLLYQSVSDSDPTYIEPNRSILSAKYFWQRNITNAARVAFSVEAYKDISSGDFSYSYGCYLLMSPEFLLKVFR